MKRGTLSDSYPVRFLRNGPGKTSELGANYNPNQCMAEEANQTEFVYLAMLDETHSDVTAAISYLTVPQTQGPDRDGEIWGKLVIWWERKYKYEVRSVLLPCLVHTQ